MITQQQVEQALTSSGDRATLLRTLRSLADDPTFRDHSALWAPALYQRDPEFFASFLRAHLAGDTRTLPTMLPWFEARGQDELFSDLYHSITSQEQWNRDLLALARSKREDDEVLRAINRRALGRRWYNLNEEAALALYRRSPTHFRDFVMRNLRFRWNQHGSYRKLQQEAHRQQDRELYWHIFRIDASKQEWQSSLELLLRQNLPAHRIEDELRLRHPHYVWNYDMRILIKFLDKHGSAVLRYIEENAANIARQDPKPLLEALTRLGDESAYWRCFFLVASPALWNQNLRALLRQRLDDESLSSELQRRTPPRTAGHWNWWTLDEEIALTLYQRNSERFRPFIERFTRRASVALFKVAQAREDHLFLDFLTFLGMRELAGVVYQAHPPAYWQGTYPQQAEALRRIEQEGALLTARLDALYADSPQRYIRHAANILSFFRPFEVWSVKRNLAHNPPFTYLFTRHREAWQQSPDGIRELLESSNIYVQIAGLEMLSEGSEAAAQRVLENLPILRALLLSRAHRNTKRRVLHCLDEAARQGPAFAAAILPLLEETMDFRSKRAVGERIMVSYVRLRRLLRDRGWPMPDSEPHRAAASALLPKARGSHA